jgi:hypothetical protein
MVICHLVDTGSERERKRERNKKMSPSFTFVAAILELGNSFAK